MSATAHEEKYAEVLQTLGAPDDDPETVATTVMQRLGRREPRTPEAAQMVRDLVWQISGQISRRGSVNAREASRSAAYRSLPEDRDAIWPIAKGLLFAEPATRAEARQSVQDYAEETANTLLNKLSVAGVAMLEEAERDLSPLG